MYWTVCSASRRMQNYRACPGIAALSSIVHGCTRLGCSARPALPLPHLQAEQLLGMKADELAEFRESGGGTAGRHCCLAAGRALLTGINKHISIKLYMEQAGSPAAWHLRSCLVCCASRGTTMPSRFKYSACAAKGFTDWHPRLPRACTHADPSRYQGVLKSALWKEMVLRLKAQAQVCEP